MIRAAIAGLGWWGKHTVRSMAGSDVLRIVVAVDVNEAQAAFTAEYGIRLTTSWEEVLADPEIDAVLLCTPHSLHPAQVAIVAAAGKHVFCEKPLALTRADAERAVAACRAAGVQLGIGHERRYEPAIVEIKRLVQSGALGTIVHVESNFSHDKLAGIPKNDWRASTVDAPVAGITAMGIHLVDAYLQIFGPMTQVFTTTASGASDRMNGDVVSVQTSFASGATGYLNATLVTPLYLRFVVFGTEAWAEARNHTHPDTPGPTTLTVQHKDGRRETHEYEWVDTVRVNAEAFARAAETGAPYMFTDEQKIGTIAALEAICRSAAINAPVAVEGGPPALPASS